MNENATWWANLFGGNVAPKETNETTTETEEKEATKPRVTSQDIANYGSAAGNLFTGISSVISSIKGDKAPANTNTVATRATERAAEGAAKDGTTTATGYAWYVWVGAVAVAALIGWGIYKIASKKA